MLSISTLNYQPGVCKLRGASTGNVGPKHLSYPKTEKWHKANQTLSYKKYNQRNLNQNYRNVKAHT